MRTDFHDATRSIRLADAGRAGRIAGVEPVFDAASHDGLSPDGPSLEAVDAALEAALAAPMAEWLARADFAEKCEWTAAAAGPLADAPSDPAGPAHEADDDRPVVIEFPPTTSRAA